MTNPIGDGMGDGRVTAAEEVPLFLASGPEHISAIYTHPRSPESDIGVLLLHSGPANISAHRNRTWTTLSRRLGHRGFHVVRLDYHGCGDSTGELADRMSSQSLNDVLSGVEELRQRGAKRLVLAGTCYGASMCLLAAEHVAELQTLCLVSPPLRMLMHPGNVQLDADRQPAKQSVRRAMSRDVVRLLWRDADYRHWFLRRTRHRLTGRTVPSFREPLRPAADAISTSTNAVELLVRAATRGVAIHGAVGEQDRGWLERQLSDAASLERIAGRFDLHVVPGELHGFKRIEGQDRVVELVLSWVEACRNGRDSGHHAPAGGQDPISA